MAEFGTWMGIRSCPRHDLRYVTRDQFLLLVYGIGNLRFAVMEADKADPPSRKYLDLAGVSDHPTQPPALCG